MPARLQTNAPVAHIMQQHGERGERRSIHLIGRHPLRRFAVIEVEHPAKPGTAMDHAVIRGNSPSSADQVVVQPVFRKNWRCAFRSGLSPNNQALDGTFPSEYS
jgi:hypothetical protein